MKFRQDHSDQRLKDYCIYCGNKTTLTREHSPSRVFLDEPFPNELSITYSCSQCNSSFSKDEEYTACILECLRLETTDIEKIEREKVKKILLHSPALHSEIKRSFDEKSRTFDVDIKRVENAILKLARGHLMFEMSERREDEPIHFGCSLFSEMDEVTYNVFNSPAEISKNDLLPEVGSRFYGVWNLGTSGLPSVYWNIVQDGRYRYICFSRACLP